MCKQFLTENEMDNLDYGIWIQSMVSTVGLMKTREIVKQYRELINFEEREKNERRKKSRKYGRRSTYRTDDRAEGSS